MKCVRSFFTIIKGTPYGRARRPASAGSLGMAANHGGGRGTSGRPAAGAGVKRGTRRCWAAAWPAASSAVAHRRGPLPLCGQPRTCPLAVPAVTHPRWPYLQELAGRSSRAGRA